MLNYRKGRKKQIEFRLIKVLFFYPWYPTFFPKIWRQQSADGVKTLITIPTMELLPPFCMTYKGSAPTNMLLATPIRKATTTITTKFFVHIFACILLFFIFFIPFTFLLFLLFYCRIKSYLALCTRILSNKQICLQDIISLQAT